jgi:hypothetical protein
MTHHRHRTAGGIALLISAAALCAAMSSPAEEARFLTQVPNEFTAKVPVAFYNRNTLYEYIDGQAVYYNSYGFTRLEHGTYQRGGGGVYTVDIYELGSPLSAFGAYRQQREADAKPYSAGAEGAMIDYLTVFYKDKFYTEIIPQTGGDDDVGAMQLLAAWADSLIPGEKTLPPELALFPPDGLVKGSERYVDESLISYSFMGRGLTAVYKLPGQDKELRVFIALTAGPDKAAEIFKGFQGKMKEPQPLAIGGVEGAKGELPYRGLSLACMQGPFVYGCMGAGDEQKAAALLAALGERLKKAMQ